jgi:hypothetical protein
MGVRCVVIAATVFVIGGSCWAVRPENTTVYKLDAAVATGELTADEALMYKFMSVYGFSEGFVPAAYRGERFSVEELACGTPVVLELWRRWPYMDAGVKRVLQEKMGLGDNRDGLFVNYRRCVWGDSSYGGYETHYYDTPEGNFRIWYTLEGSNALIDPSDDDGNGVPDDVELTGADMEFAYSVYLADGWFDTPVPQNQPYLPLRDYYADIDGEPWPGDGVDYGGSDRWDVYLGSLGVGLGGVAYPDQPFTKTEPRSDYSGYNNLANEYWYGSFNTAVIGAHEFNHSVQFMLDATEPEGWYFEATAMWAEDECYPGAADPRGRVNSYLSDTTRSLDDAGDGGYMSSIFNFYLDSWEERYWLPPEWEPTTDHMIVRDVWRALAWGDEWYAGDEDTDRMAKDSIDFLVDCHDLATDYPNYYAFKYTFENWTGWNWFTGERDDGEHYFDGANYRTVTPGETWDEYPVNAESQSTPDLLDHLGHIFLRFDMLPDWDAAVFAFTASQENDEDTRDWGGRVVATKNGELWENLAGDDGEWTLMFTPQDIGIIQIRNPSQYESIAACLCNSSIIGKDLDYAYTFTQTSDLEPPTVALAPVIPDGNREFIELLLGSDEPLYGMPEIAVDFTPTGGETERTYVDMAGTGDQSFTGTFVVEPGGNGTGTVEYGAADLGGNIVSGSKSFSAGTLSAGGGIVGAEGAFLRAPSGAFSTPTLVTIFEGETYDETSIVTGLTVERSGGLSIKETKTAEEAIETAEEAIETVEAPIETIGTSYIYGPEWANLGAPVNVILSYDDLDVTKEDYLSVYQWNGSGWTDLGGTIDKAHKRVTADVNSLGEFILGYGDKKEGDGGGFIPTSYALYQSYPNPAGSSAKVKYALPEDGHVTIKLYNIAGQVVKVLVDEEMAAGTHVEPISTDGMASGVYLYRMEAGDYSAVKKMVVTR